MQFDHLYLTPTSLEPSGGASGQATDIAIHAKEIIRIRERLTAIYVSESTYDAMRCL